MLSWAKASPTCRWRTRSGARPGTPSAAPGLAGALASRPLLGRLLPESGTATASGGDGEGMARQQMFGAVLGLLAEVAAAGPVLLVFEDLHFQVHFADGEWDHAEQLADGFAVRVATIP